MKDCDPTGLWHSYVTACLLSSNNFISVLVQYAYFSGKAPCESSESVCVCSIPRLFDSTTNIWFGRNVASDVIISYWTAQAIISWHTDIGWPCCICKAAIVYQEKAVAVGTLCVGNRRCLVCGWRTYVQWLHGVREDGSRLEKEQWGHKLFKSCCLWVVGPTQSLGHCFSAGFALKLNLQCIPTNETDWEHSPCFCNRTYS